ncbi:MAG: ferritin [Planctomycetia bacterium]|nr:ferritin [Planctomycetia bacterium]
MLSETINEALNKQLVCEYSSFWLYLSMSAQTRQHNLLGFAHWLELQANEEQTHGKKILEYIEDRNGKIILGEIQKPQNEWNSMIDLFENVLTHEQMVSQKINEIYDLAHQENDNATAVFLQWFIMEQVEEEATSLSILERLKAINGMTGPLFYFDHELGKRKE